MDFGIGFLSNNVMLPFLDFFYGIVPSYGLAIVALTLAVRFALYPLSAGQIRSMRKMKVVQPVMQQRQKEIQERYKDDPAKQQEEMGKLYKEFGNPLAGCLPLVIQMPVLFALFATLRGSPFADVNYPVNLQILPREQMEQVQPQAFATPPQNIYISDKVHEKILALLPGGTRLGVGDEVHVELQTPQGTPFSELNDRYPDVNLAPRWQITQGTERAEIAEDGTLIAKEPGDVTLQATVPGLAANKGFLFIQALGRVGAWDPDGAIRWDIVAMILAFGVSLYVNQLLSGSQQSANPSQGAVNQITPIIFSGMFFFFPLPAGVLMYMLIANIFQTLQTYILSREPLPAEIQKLVDEQATQEEKKDQSAKDKDRSTLPFEPGQRKKA
ncbi:membrane protein insertase YidC [Leptolyngbya sp. FACHB-261]|uniref:membrane protein insertase YidC n=1 Tax=Leptolyngbya sp. FACHB-261 TaxID=2692806 RepID=UPI0016834D7A|nr:membrane protein insertase YidC [Leptolyngbya sp. FACHB-261]MBD2103849.1 membrane protein insertase YidC [Leptolyngbya sp. FACHB-261]